MTFDVSELNVRLTIAFTTYVCDEEHYTAKQTVRLAIHFGTRGFALFISISSWFYVYCVIILCVSLLPSVYCFTVCVYCCLTYFSCRIVV